MSRLRGLVKHRRHDLEEPNVNEQDNNDRQIGKCTECGEERQQGGFRMFRRGGLGVCDRCKKNPPPPRTYGDPRWDAAHAPLVTNHV